MITLSMTLSGVVSAETRLQIVNLTVVSRCGTAGVLERAGLNLRDGRTVGDIPLSRVGLIFYSGHATVAPGRYLIGVTRSRCWGGTEITVLPGHDRDVGIEVTPLGGVHYDAHAFLDGTLPFGGFVRGALIGKGYDDQAEIDRGAYYVEHETPGSYLLKLSYGDSLECRIPVNVPEQGLRLDISVQQAQRCLGFPYHIPSTGESGFNPLFPSPTPNP